MKFEYEGEAVENRRMMAFIDNRGDLFVRVYDTEVLYLIRGGGCVYSNGDFEDYASSHGVKKAFYPGDKITITF